MDYITSQLKDSVSPSSKGKYYGLNRRDSKESLDSMKDGTLSSNEVSSNPSFEFLNFCFYSFFYVLCSYIRSGRLTFLNISNLRSACQLSSVFFETHTEKSSFKCSKERSSCCMIKHTICCS